MLSVGVDAPDVLVPALVGEGVARCDPLSQPAVLAEREHLGAVGGGDGGRSVRRAVVDDEDGALRKLGVQLVEHGREVRLLVPGGDEDERVGHGMTRDVR